MKTINPGGLPDWLLSSRVLQTPVLHQPLRPEHWLEELKASKLLFKRGAELPKPRGHSLRLLCHEARSEVTLPTLMFKMRSVLTPLGHLNCCIPGCDRISNLMLSSSPPPPPSAGRRSHSEHAGGPCSALAPQFSI